MAATIHLLLEVKQQIDGFLYPNESAMNASEA